MSSAPIAPPAARVRVPAGTTAGAAVREPDLPNKGRRPSWSSATPTAAPDLSWVPGPDAEVEPVAADTEDGRSVIRHSAAHVLAQAVQDKFPDAKLGIGPPIKDGFYYDFDVDRPFTPEDLADLEKRMKRIVKSGQRFARRVTTGEEARAELAFEPYKLELIDLKCDASGEEVGGGRGRRADHLRQPARAYRRARLGRSVPRPARADHPLHPGVQAHPVLRRVLAGQRAEPATPADLRYCLGIRRSPCTRTCNRMPRRSGGTTEAGRGAGPVLVPRRVGFRSGGFPSQGRHHPQGAGGVLAGQARRRRLRVREHPAHHQVPAVRDLRAPGLVRGRHVPGDAPGRRDGRTARCASRARTTTSSR